MSWISVCGIDDVSEDEPKAVEVNDELRIALASNRITKFF